MRCCPAPGGGTTECSWCEHVSTCAAVPVSAWVSLQGGQGQAVSKRCSNTWESSQPALVQSAAAMCVQCTLLMIACICHRCSCCPRRLRFHALPGALLAQCVSLGPRAPVKGDSLPGAAIWCSCTPINPATLSRAPSAPVQRAGLLL